MRVLFVIDSLGSGGAERSTALIQEPLRKLGVDTLIATLYRAADGDESRVRERGFDVRILEGHSGLKRAASLRRLIEQFEPDVIHTSLYRSDQLGRWASVGLGVPVISSLVGSPRRLGREWAGYPPRWKLAPALMIDFLGARIRTTRFHAVTEGVADEFAGYFRLPRSRFAVVERGRDKALALVKAHDARAKVRADLGVSNDAPLLISVGRIDRQKQHGHLIAAGSKIIDALPDARVLIVGRDGDGRRDLDLALEAVGNHRASFIELGYRDDVASLIAASDAFLLHSRNEGAAGAAIEALAIGTPIVAYPLRGLRGILDDERNSLVVARQDPSLLADAACRVLRDAELAHRITSAGQADFTERFELSSASARLLDLYREVVGSAHRRRSASSHSSKRLSARARSELKE